MDTKTLFSELSNYSNYGINQSITDSIINHLESGCDIDFMQFKSYDEYKSVFHIRHDLTDLIISQVNGWQFGEVPIHQTIINLNLTIRDPKYLRSVSNQTPDHVIMDHGIIKIIDISVSASPRSRYQEKLAKYSLLRSFFSMNGYRSEIVPIVINSKNPYASEEDLAKYKIGSVELGVLSKIFRRSNVLSSNCLNFHPLGQSWREQDSNLIFDDIKLDYSIDDCTREYLQSEDKGFHSKDDMIQCFDRHCETLSNDDNDLIDHYVKLMDEMKPTLSSGDSCDLAELIEKLKTRSTTTRLRSILPLPYLEYKKTDMMTKSTSNDFMETISMCERIRDCDNPELIEMARCFLQHSDSVDPRSFTNSDFLFPLRLSRESKETRAVEGPDRKKYIKMGKMDHIKEQNKHTGYALDPSTNVDCVYSLSWLFSQRDHIKTARDINESSDIVSRLSGFGLNYAQYCEEIYREVTINGLRKDRRKQALFRPTSMKGVFLYIAEGAKIRVGDLPSIVWFQLVVDKSIVDINLDFEHQWAFKDWRDSGTVYYSRWISADAHRLDHYLRCKDKILMAYVTLMDFRYRDAQFDMSFEQTMEISITESLIHNINKDHTNTLGLISLIYLEDKRSTSKMLQDVRYLVMTMLSFIRYDGSVMEKFNVPMRTPLQLYLFKRICKFHKSMSNTIIPTLFKPGRFYYDRSHNVLSHKFAGAALRLPNPLVGDGTELCDFTFILSEMYFCMLFNKNQDDPTHSSFQILKKMLEGENHYQNLKQNGDRMIYGYNVDDRADASDIVLNPRKHVFSRRAIEIGSVLLRMEAGSSTSDYKIDSRKFNINKDVSEFATFKSSSNFDRKFFEMNVNNQNSRRRCIEGVIELINSGKRTSFEVANSNKDNDTTFQIFKKNQIGGVREILILDIESRIKINILETLSRNICRRDQREMLTHGNSKQSIYKGLLMKSRQVPGKRVQLYINSDKSRWGPTFIPIQFLYLFTRYSKHLSRMFPFILQMLMKHQNKVCILPQKLIDAWQKDQSNKLQHRDDPLLQNLKEKFLQDAKLFFRNHSNMGQGILHYTSSLLHISMLSLRDEIYKRYLKKHGIVDLEHNFDLVSSDDSFTVLSLPRDNIKLARFMLDKFLVAQELSERLFNCRTSTSKSSISLLIAEFNSLFASQMNFYPTTLKFAISSVSVYNTDSFHRMVKQYYSSSRQLVENGGSMELYLIASKLNKMFCEKMYHTHNLGKNVIEGVSYYNIPYHLGFYPIFSPELMILLGPDYHNYLIYKRFDLLNNREKKLFISSHKLSKEDLIESLSLMDDGDTVLGGLLKIEASMGPVTQLSRIRSKCHHTRDDIESTILNDPTIIIRQPENMDETKFKTSYKLYVKGAKEAVKNIASSIYFGRVSATVTADAFMVPGLTELPTTYHRCLDLLIEKGSTKDDHLDKIMRFTYPLYDEYEVAHSLGTYHFGSRNRSIYQVMEPTKHMIKSQKTKLIYSVSDILAYLWCGKVPREFNISKIMRDFGILQEYYPLLKGSLDETMDQFSGTDMDKTRMTVLLILKLSGLRTKTMKAISYAHSSSHLKESCLSFVKELSQSCVTFDADHKMHTINYGISTYDDLLFAYNYYVILCDNNIPNREELLLNYMLTIDDDRLQMFQYDPSIHKTVKLRVMIPYLECQRVDNMISWTMMAQQPLHVWDQKQSYDRKTKEWYGDLSVTSFIGKNMVRITYYGGHWTIFRNDCSDPRILQLLVDHTTTVCELNISEELRSGKLSRGNWVTDDNGCHESSHMSGFHIEPDVSIELNMDNIVSHVEFNKEYIEVKDVLNRKVFRTKTGLLSLSSDVMMDRFQDVKCYGLQLSSIIRLGGFSRMFDPLNLDRKQCIFFMDDIIVEKPKLSEQTINHLKLSGFDIDDEEKTYHDIAIIPTTDLIDDLLSVPVEDIRIPADYEDLADFATYGDVHSMFDSLSVEQEVVLTKKILNNVRNLKYFMIIRCNLLTFDINKQRLSRFKMLGDKFKMVYWSCLFLYDRRLRTSGDNTPEVSSDYIDNEFLEKFDLF
jgi:hypothetical protein